MTYVITLTVNWEKFKGGRKLLYLREQVIWDLFLCLLSLVLLSSLWKTITHNCWIALTCILLWERENSGLKWVIENIPVSCFGFRSLSVCSWSRLSQVIPSIYWIRGRSCYSRHERGIISEHFPSLSKFYDGTFCQNSYQSKVVYDLLLIHCHNHQCRRAYFFK